jgi:hypothetical protein
VPRRSVAAGATGHHHIGIAQVDVGRAGVPIDDDHTIVCVIGDERHLDHP